MKLMSILKRRTHGGNYYARYELNGSIKFKSLKTKNKNEAYEKWNKYQSTYDTRLNDISVKKVLLTKGIEDYLNLKKNKVQAATFRSDQLTINKLLKYFTSCNRKYISDITKKNIDDLILSLDKQGISDKTINNYLSILNTMFEHFLSQSYIDFNIIDSKKHRRKRKKDKPQIINKNEARLIIQEFKEIEKIDHRMFMLMPFGTGMRSSEIKGLHRKNIDLSNHSIKICEKQTDSDEEAVSMLKTGASYRTIPIPTENVLLLEDFLEQTENEYPFSNLTYNIYKRYCWKVNKKLELKYNYHQGRHFYASLLIESKKYSPKDIQVLMGHDDIRTTYDVYGHLFGVLDTQKINEIDFFT